MSIHWPSNELTTALIRVRDEQQLAQVTAVVVIWRHNAQRCKLLGLLRLVWIEAWRVVTL